MGNKSARKAEARVSRHHTWFKLIVPLFAVALLVLVLEVILRVAGYNPIGRPTEGTVLFLAPSNEPDVEYVLVPNTRGRAWDTDISINSLGFRDREYDARKPDGARRILVIGDSVTFGNALRVADTYPKQLEVMCAGASPTVEVLNLGVGGYDAINEAGLLASRGQSLDPDHVVIGYCINDAGVQSANLTFIRFLQKYGGLVRLSRVAQLVSARFERAMQMRDFSESNREEAFVRRYADRVRPLDDDSEVREMIVNVDRYLKSHPVGPSSPYASWYASPARIGRIRYAFERFRDLAQEGGYGVTLLIIPLLEEEEHANLYDQVYAIVEHEARRVGFDVLNTRAALAAVGMRKLMQVRDDRADPMHPNAKGHKVLARLLHDRLCTPSAPWVR